MELNQLELSADLTEDDAEDIHITADPVNPLPWDKLKVVYEARKLGRRSDPFNPHPAMVATGKLFDGLECRAANVISQEDWRSEHQAAEGFIPKIGACVLLMASRWNSGNNQIRTSLIEDFYIHEDETETSKDKIIMIDPENLKLLDKVAEWNKGDILLVTMNSLYHLKAVHVK